jgi:hypothetical protein
VAGGDGQLARPFAPLAEPLRLRAWLGDQPATGLPLRIEAPSQSAVETAGSLRTDENGWAEIAILRLREVPAVLSLRVEPDVDALRPERRLDAATEATLRAIAARGVDYRITAERARRPLRVAVLIDERRDASRPQRSLLAAALADRLNRAGFRVVADRELGERMAGLLGATAEPEPTTSVDVQLSGLVDVVVTGWCETRPGSDNQGWAVSVLADAEVKAVEVASGEVLASRTMVGRVGFGEREERAEVAAVRALADEIADDLTVELGGGTEAWPPHAAVEEAP